MIPYTLDDLERYYARIKHMARRAFEKGDFTKSLSHIDSAAYMVWILNNIYADSELEELMGKISDRLVGEKSTGYPVKAGRWLFYDQIGNDTVLAPQYLRALMAWGVEILYVLDAGGGRGPLVMSELEAYDRATVVILDKNIGTRVKEFGHTLEAIQKFGPEKAFIHAPAGGAFGVALLHALKSTVKYRIVPGDHHFYLGTSVSDYAVEFRPFGATLAIQKRGMKRERILMQPYYPVIREAPFEGFDFDVAGRTLLFSGGAYSKILGGDEIYFRIIKKITDAHPGLIVQYNGGGTPRNRKKVKGLVKKYGLEGVFHLDGFRPDINEIMKRCDIYIGTYPLCGGLMSQYAALNGKPILQYHPPGDGINNVEDILGVTDPRVKITFTDIDALVSQAGRLIESPALRRTEGERLRRALITPREFASRLKTTVEGNTTWDGPLVEIDYGLLTARNLTLVNKYSEGIERRLVGTYPFASLWLFPKAALNFLANFPYMLGYIIGKIAKCLRKRR